MSSVIQCVILFLMLVELSCLHSALDKIGSEIEKIRKQPRSVGDGGMVYWETGDDSGVIDCNK